MALFAKKSSLFSAKKLPVKGEKPPCSFRSRDAVNPGPRQTEPACGAGSQPFYSLLEGAERGRQSHVFKDLLADTRYSPVFSFPERRLVLESILGEIGAGSGSTAAKKVELSGFQILRVDIQLRPPDGERSGAAQKSGQTNRSVLSCPIDSRDRRPFL
jgi:hypothetical protein